MNLSWAPHFVRLGLAFLPHSLSVDWAGRDDAIQIAAWVGPVLLLAQPHIALQQQVLLLLLVQAEPEPDSAAVAADCQEVASEEKRVQELSFSSDQLLTGETTPSHSLHRLVHDRLKEK